jgi:hypothetical protein
MPEDHIGEFNRAIEAIQPLLGKLATEFAKLEDTTTFTITALMRLSHKEGIILDTIIQAFSSRIRLLTAMIKLHLDKQSDDTLRETGLRVCSMIGEANSDRNNLLHDAWDGYSPQTKTLHKAMRYELQNGELHFIPIIDVSALLIEQTIGFIQRTNLVLSHWRSALNHRMHPAVTVAPSPLPEKFYEGSPLHRHIQDQRKKA